MKCCCTWERPYETLCHPAPQFDQVPVAPMAGVLLCHLILVHQNIKTSFKDLSVCFRKWAGGK